MSVTSSSVDHLSPQQAAEPQTKRRPWTAREDALLIDSVNRLGSARGPGSAWSEISSIVGGTRTNKDCRKRWFHSLDPSLRKGRWSKQEDEALKRLYKEMGPQWKEIALLIPGRKDDQCSKRWRDVLDPSLISKEPWTPLEDALLLQLFEALGAKWSVISDCLPGRSPLACRNRSRKYFDLTRGNKKGGNPFARHASPHHTVGPSRDNDHVSDCSSADGPALDGTPGLLLALPGDSLPGDVSQEDSTLSGKRKITPEILCKDTTNVQQDVIPTPFLDQDYMGEWLSLFQQADPVPASLINLSSQIQPPLAASITSPRAPSRSSTASSTSSLSSPPPLQPVSLPAPVSDPWALFAALGSGQASVNVDARLLRKLMTDAAKGSSAVGP
ncbi:hypothetical protein IAR50_002412 [Cryptococcus sp. DSM 104548]